MSNILGMGIPNIVKLVKEGNDFYRSIACQLLAKPFEEVTSEERELVKKRFMDFIYLANKDLGKE